MKPTARAYPHAVKGQGIYGEIKVWASPLRRRRLGLAEHEAAEDLKPWRLHAHRLETVAEREWMTLAKRLDELEANLGEGEAPKCRSR
ncbi:MAG: hypothetical protein WB662_09205 [Methyloceanibacter sp.]